MSAATKVACASLAALLLFGCPEPEPPPEPRPYEFTRFDCDLGAGDVALDRLEIGARTVFGPQGGTHIDWEVSLVGERVPMCAEFTLREGLWTGHYRRERSDTTVETINGREVRTSFYTGSDSFASEGVEVTAYGLTARPGFPAVGLGDAGSDDAGPDDAGSLDAGLFDGGLFDGGLFDAGAIDAGAIDAGEGADGGDAGEGADGGDAGAVDSGPDAG